MTLRFTKTAARQLDTVLQYIAEESPQGASRVHARIETAIELLLHFPEAGQVTDRPGIRRLVVVGSPYVLTYRFGSGGVVIRTIRHGARWPLR